MFDRRDKGVQRQSAKSGMAIFRPWGPHGYRNEKNILQMYHFYISHHFQICALFFRLINFCPLFKNILKYCSNKLRKNFKTRHFPLKLQIYTSKTVLSHQWRRCMYFYRKIFNFYINITLWHEQTCFGMICLTNFYFLSRSEAIQYTLRKNNENRKCSLIIQQFFVDNWRWRRSPRCRPFYRRWRWWSW